MKRLLFAGFFGLMALIGNNVAAQGVTLTKGEESKKVDDESVLNSWYLGRNEERVFWLTTDDDRDDAWCVLELDRNMNVANQMALPLDKDFRVVAINQNGWMANVIMVDSSKAKSALVVKFMLEMDSLALVDGKVDTLASFSLAKGDRCKVWGAVSPNGQYMGLLTLQEFTAKKQYTSKAMLFDRAMNEVWNHEYPVERTSCVAVSDIGELVTLGFGREGVEERFFVSVIGEKGGENYSMAVNCDRVNDMRIVNVLDRKVICAGIFSPTKSDPEEQLVGGTAMMVFDLDSSRVTGFTLKPFENEDVNILTNKKTKKVQRDKEVPMVVPLASTATSYGAVFAVGHRHMLRYKNANGTISTTYYCQGIQLVAIDDNAEVKWVRNLRRNDFEKENDELLYISLFAEGDAVFLVKSESPKYPADYNIAKEAKEYEMGDKGNLVMYQVAENGDVTKTVLEQKTKHMLVSSAMCDDGSVLLTTMRGKKSRLVEMGF